MNHRSHSLRPVNTHAQATSVPLMFQGHTPFLLCSKLGENKAEAGFFGGGGVGSEGVGVPVSDTIRPHRTFDFGSTVWFDNAGPLC